MSFVSTDPANHKGKTDTWLTPLSIIFNIGPFDLDPCAFPKHPTATNLICLPQDGLKAVWKGRVWLNPPYSEAEIWLDKLHEHGCGTALLFNRLDTKYQQRHMSLATSVFFLQGRIKFLKPDKTYGGSAGSGSVLISYGYTPDYSMLKGWKAK